MVKIDGTEIQSKAEKSPTEYCSRLPSLSLNSLALGIINQALSSLMKLCQSPSMSM
jgi:hypothetical protein